MDNFQYSVQLSDQDWAEFSATADECGLLQAGLASGDELFSSDIDQGDSSGSSPPGPPPLLTGQLAPQEKGCQACEEEGSVATWQLASRSQCEPVLALGTSKQAAGTSAQSEALLSFSLGTALPDQWSSFLGSVDPSDPMQRFLQGPAPNSSDEPSQSSNSPCHTAIPQKSPKSPDTPLRSPGRKKRRAAGAKGGRYSDTPGPAMVPPGSAKLSEARPEESLGLAGASGKGSGAGTANMMAGAQQNKPQPDSAGAVSIPVPITEQHTDQIRMTPRAELHRDSVPVQEAHRAASMAEADEGPSLPSTKPQPDVALSTPDSTPRLLVDLPVSVAVPSRALPHSASKTESDVAASTPVPGAEAVAPSQDPILQMKVDIIETQITVPPRGHQEKPEGDPGHALREPPPGHAQTPKKKKVRFSMTAPSPEDSGSKEATGPPSPASAWPSTPGMAVGGREGHATWDAVAVGPRTPQPRILKHLPPPAPSASAGTGSGSCFAVTLPEAYEFFFCDTIEEEEEEEGANEEAVASQALGDVQWPDICEFFFQDFHTQRLGHQGSCSPTPPPGADPASTVPPGDPVPFSIPEAYEHFLGEDRFGGEVPPTPLLQVQTSETPRNIGTRTPPEPGPAIVEQLSLAAKRTVLLANIGTISAIRYFRWQVRQGRSPSSSPSHDHSSSS